MYQLDHDDKDDNNFDFTHKTKPLDSHGSDGRREREKEIHTQTSTQTHTFTHIHSSILSVSLLVCSRWLEPLRRRLDQHLLVGPDQLHLRQQRVCACSSTSDVQGPLAVLCDLKDVKRKMNAGSDTI